MKSIKEKAKAYDEALEKAKKLQETCDSQAVVGWCEYLFPELVESEGEKIRKWCISHFKECINVIKDNDEYKEYLSNKVLAWLERQGENAIYNIPSREVILAIWDLGNEWKELTNGSISTEYGTTLDYIQKHWHESEYYLKEKQGEQKPADSYCQENCKGFQETGKCFADGECKAKREAEQKPVIKFKTAEEILGISSDEYNKIVDKCLFGEQKLTEFERGLFDMLTDISKPRTVDCVKSHSEKLLSIARKMIALEQKPEENKGNIGGFSANWSEEDGVYLEHIITAVILYYTDDKSKENPWREELLRWLKSLKDRVQPKQEYSEEDIDKLSDFDKALLTAVGTIVKNPQVYENSASKLEEFILGYSTKLKELAQKEIPLPLHEKK